VTWLPLADHDPVPGDHYGTGDLGTYFSYEATQLRNIATELRRLDAGMWEGEAADSFRERRKDLTPRLEALAKRWDATSQALKLWADDMDCAQTLARRARLDAEAAEERRSDAQAKLDSARGEFRPDLLNLAVAPIGPPPPDDLIPWLEREVTEREADLARARTVLGQATELYEDGARRCERALHAAADDTLENRGGIVAGASRTLHHVVRRYPQIKTMAKGLGLAAGALAIGASMFTGVGELATLAFVVGGLATTLDTALLVSGDGRWTTVAWDAFGLLTFGLGRAFASAARGTAAAKTGEGTRRLATQSLRGVVAEGVASAEPITGAAARSRLLKLYEGWKGFASEAATGMWPDSRNWVRAVTFWKQIEVPPADVLRLSRDVVRYGTTGRVIEGVGRANEIRGIVAEEQEALDKKRE